jgi:hypothetical protein
MPTYFHTTDAAEAILREGFRDGEGSYGFVGLTLRGVFLAADRPIDVNDGAKGDQVLAVELDGNLDEYEIIEEGAPEGGVVREWCVPASLLNTRGVVRLLTEDEVDELTAARWRDVS